MTQENTGLSGDREGWRQVAKKVHTWHPDLQGLAKPHLERAGVYPTREDVHILGREVLEDLVQVDGSSELMAETLHRREEADMNGFMRPVYEIGGRQVVFRNRCEAIEFDGVSVTAVANEVSVSRVEPYINSDDSERSEIHDAESRVEEYIRRNRQDAPDNFLVIPNTPLGLVETAIVLGNQELTEVRSKMIAGEYNDPACRAIVDSILAAISIDDAGNPALDGNFEVFDIDGFALALSALTDNPDAKRLVGARLDGLYAAETQRRQEIASVATSYMNKLEESGEFNPLPIEKICLVHTTSHAIELDDDGNAVFRPFGHYDSGSAIPRSTWHATINSSVYPHAQADGAWGADNRVVIAPLEGVIAQNGNPESLNAVDTWLVAGPGERITIPSFILIEPTSDGDDLVVEHDGVIKLLIKPDGDYSEAQQQAIADLSSRFGRLPINEGDPYGCAKLLREALVQRVLSEHFNIAPDERCAPAIDGHGATSPALDRRLHDTALALGIRGRKHFEQPEDAIEKSSFRTFLSVVSKHKVLDRQLSYASSGPLKSKRLALVNGGIDTRLLESDDSDTLVFR